MEHYEKQKLIIDNSLSPSSPSILYFSSLAYSFVCIGLSVSISGPTLSNLQEQNNSTIDQVSYIFFVRNAGSLLGNIFVGGIIDKYIHYGKSFLCLSVFVMAITTALVPFIGALSVLIFTQSIFGIAMGMTDNVAQMLLLKCCNQHTVGPYLHILHFAFGR